MPEIIFAFRGAILDEKTMCSDSPDEKEAVDVQRMYLWFGLGKGNVERSEDMDRRNLGIFRLPSPTLAERAKRENWSES
jgi:hypothetical protein